MLRSSYRIATVWGIPIKIHISLIVLLGVFCLEAAWPAPRRHNVLLNVATALTTGIAAFACIALHELGHSFVALRKGCRVREITLMFMGGAAQMERIPTKPRDEFLMAVAGPLVSLVLAAVGLGAGYYLAIRMNSRAAQFVGEHIFRLGGLNLMWAGFNLLPIFPMDGGRVFRALLTPRFGRLRATAIAARLGQFLAISGGIWAFYPPRQLILVAIAFFIYAMAGNELRMVQIQELAKQRGFDSWPPFGPDNDPNPAGENEVIVSPPPYRRGPGSRTEIRWDE